MITFLCIAVTFLCIALGEALAVLAATVGHYTALRGALAVRTTDAPDTQVMVGAMPPQASMYARPARVAPPAPVALGHAALSALVVGWMARDEKREIRAERRAANIAAMALEAVAAIDVAMAPDHSGPYHAGKISLRYNDEGYEHATWSLANSWADPSPWQSPGSRAESTHRVWQDEMRMHAN
jgi:hypothetical protein